MSQIRRRSTILIAEDDEDDLLFIQDALEDCQYAGDLRCVKDGEELMDYLRHRQRYARPGSAPRPDLILLDLRMPKKDGFEVLQEMRDDARLRSIPVVVLTASRVEWDIQNSYALGANSYLTKPGEFRALVEALRSLLNLHRLLGVPEVHWAS